MSVTIPPCLRLPSPSPGHTWATGTWAKVGITVGHHSWIMLGLTNHVPHKNMMGIMGIQGYNILSPAAGKLRWVNVHYQKEVAQHMNGWMPKIAKRIPPPFQVTLNPATKITNWKTHFLFPEKHSECLSEGEQMIIHGPPTCKCQGRSTRIRRVLGLHSTWSL